MASWITYLLVVNALAFLLYGCDKWQARRGGRRISEAHLLGVAAIGGSLGAGIGQQVFRHKTSKASFRISFGLIVILQIIVVLYMALGSHM